jgi:cytochrome c oxidase subunit II
MIQAAAFYNDWMRKALNLPPQASTIAEKVDQLHFFVITVSTLAAVGIGLAAVFLFAKYRYRGKRMIGQEVQPGIWFELVCVAGPLAFFLLWFFIGFKQYIEICTVPDDAMEVYVMGKKWMWKFAYPDGPNAVGVLRVPVGRPVKLLMTSRDVIHSFFIPAFRLKKDVVPGRYSELWFTATIPGSYEVFCAEYCGTGHSMMRAEVVAMKPDEFDQWLAAQRNASIARQQDSYQSAQEPPRTEANMVLQGQRLAGEKGCLKCHSVDGSPHIAPTWLGMYHRREQLSTGETIRIDEAYITESMMDPTAKLVAGYGPVMPTFMGKLTAPESAAIVEYIKSLRDPQLQAQPSEGPIYEPGRRP